MNEKEIEQGHQELSTIHDRLKREAPEFLRDPYDHDYVITYPLHSVLQKEPSWRIEADAAPREWLAREPVSPFSCLYLHIGFCRYRCRYCRHYKVDVQPKKELVERTIDALLLEADLVLESLGDASRGIRSVRVGGGTPTFLEPEQLERLFSGISARLPDSDDLWSLEAKPITITPEKLQVLREQGFSRISLGVQTLDPDAYAYQHHGESVDEVYRALEQVKAAGFSSVNVDFISGLPQSTTAQWNRSCEAMAQIAQEGLCTEISLQAHHDDPRTTSWKSAQQRALVDEWLHIWMVRRTLESRSWHPVSSWLFLHPENPGREVFDNLHNVDISFIGYYFGLGNSAYTEQPTYLYVNEWDLQPYLERVLERRTLPTFAGLHLSPERMLAGELAKAVYHACPAISLKRLESKYGADIYSLYEEEFQRLQQTGLATIEDGLVKMTEVGTYCNFEASKLFFLPEDEEFRHAMNDERRRLGRRYDGF